MVAGRECQLGRTGEDRGGDVLGAPDPLEWRCGGDSFIEVGTATGNEGRIDDARGNGKDTNFGRENPRQRLRHYIDARLRCAISDGGTNPSERSYGRNGNNQAIAGCFQQRSKRSNGGELAPPIHLKHPID